MWCRMIGLVLAVASLEAVEPAFADGFVVEGLLDCGAWVKSRTEGKSAIFEGYLVGFMNGLVLGSGTEFWRATGAKVSQDQVFLWMDNYCREHPLADVVKGAIDLMNERTGYRYQQRISR